MRLGRALMWTACFGLVVGALWFSTTLWLEAYGAGPPHYSRTTNMDKWSNPVPVIALVMGTAMSCCGLMLYFLRRK